MSILWKSVIGYEDCYEVSNQGVVRSLSRKFEQQVEYKKTGRKRIHNQTGRVLKLHYDKGGYLRCFLSKNSKVKAFLVHRVVWEAFNEPIPKTYQIDHTDSNKENNCLDNLQCLSRRAHGELGVKKGEYVAGNTRLSKGDVIKIKQLLKDETMSYQTISEQFGVHRATIQAIYKGRTWSHVGLNEQSEYDKGYQQALYDHGLITRAA